MLDPRMEVGPVLVLNYHINYSLMRYTNSLTEV